MRKKCLAILLAVVLAAGLLPGTAFAAGSGSAPLQNAKISLSAQYEYAGALDPWWTLDSYRSAPVVTDLDGDGKLEVLNAAYTLYVMDAATGAEKWRVNAGRDRATSDQDNVGGGIVFCDFKVLDIDADGSKEIVIAYGNGMVSVLDKNGNFKWQVQPTTASIRSLAVDDLDGDGKMEVIVGAGIEDPVCVWVYRCDGTLAPGWPQLDASQNGSYQKSPAYITETAWSNGIYGNGITTGDLDGDGLPEIIVPTDTPFIDAYNYDGSLVKASSSVYGGRAWGKIALWEDYAEEKACKNEGWGWPEDLNTRAQTYWAQLASSGAVYTDVDGDGTSEVVITALITDRTTYITKGNNVSTIDDSRYMTVFILNQDRTRYVNKELGFDWTSAPNELTSSIRGPLKSGDAGSMSGNVFPVPVCSDLDGDGYQEILFNSYDGKVHCFSLDKTERWSFTLPKSVPNTVYEYATPVVCRDLDGDGTQEVIFASWLDGKPTAGMKGALYVLSCNGELLAKMDLHDAYNASLNNGVMGAPVVQDIDNDGKYEILLNTQYYALSAYEVSTGAAAPVATSFNDVKDSDWFAGNVKWAVENGITSGTGDGNFTPARTCTHAEIITFLWRAAGKSAPTTFDVPVQIDSSQYYATAALWAAGKGVIDSSFNPNAPCTRMDTALYVWKAFGKPNSDEFRPRFNDIQPEVYGWSSDEWKAVNWIATKGIIQGTGDGNFTPGRTCMRSEIVAILQRAYG